MDRRQRKTREAIFCAFIDLLSKKSLNKITVAEIIDKADIGRATFYAHFETKDFLLKELCKELFCHIFDALNEHGTEHKHIFECEAPDSVFLHLLRHIKHNDNQILQLLSCENNELFLQYFKAELLKLCESQLDSVTVLPSNLIPKDFLINHIASTFTETVRWWIKSGMEQSPETINEYFLTVINKL